jgi:hypothetical protein
MHIEYFPALVPIFMFDMRRKHLQTSGRKSKQKKNNAAQQHNIVGRFYHKRGCHIVRPDTDTHHAI